MRTISKKSKGQDGYLTIYASLIFGIILSLLLALIEGAATSASRMQAELVTDLGLDSVFAEYHRELYQQYGVFMIDTSYGEEWASVGQIEQHLSEYMQYNLDPRQDLTLWNRYNFLLLENPYLELEEARFATDEEALAWRRQVIDYMFQKYGIEFLNDLQENLQIVESNQLLTADIEGQLANYCQNLEKTIAEKEIQEQTTLPKNDETEDGFSYDGITDLAEELTKRGILSQVMPENCEISSRSIDPTEYVSARKEKGLLNQGNATVVQEEQTNALGEKLLYGAYIMDRYGCFTKEKENGYLAYQVEYILFGKNSDLENLETCAKRLLALRAASNYLYLTTDTEKKEQAQAIAMLICTLCMVPEASEVLTYVLLGIWAYAESVLDVQTLLEGKRVPLIKSKTQWQLGLSGILAQKVTGTSAGDQGLKYEDYLSILLATMNRNKQVDRSLDVVEMDIRQTTGNEGFCIDRCVDYIKVGFGFENTYGHNFVFRRAMHY